MISKRRVLAIDPGEKRIGIAISDESGTIANPIGVFRHISREKDAAEIILMCEEKKVDAIVIGCALGTENEISFEGRKSVRLADKIRQLTTIPVLLWDESDSTRIARETRRKMHNKKNRQLGHQDDLAAAIVLQSYLDSNEKKD
jgi:putative Holliday junction resolvase